MKTQFFSNRDFPFRIFKNFQVKLFILIPLLFGFAFLPRTSLAQEELPKYVVYDVEEPSCDEDGNFQVSANLTGLDLPSELVDPECAIPFGIGSYIGGVDENGNTAFVIAFASGGLQVVMDGNDVVWEILENSPATEVTRAWLLRVNNIQLPTPLPIPIEVSAGNASDLNYPVPAGTPGISKMTVTLPIDATPELAAIFAANPNLDIWCASYAYFDFYNMHNQNACQDINDLFHQGAVVVTTPLEGFEQSLSQDLSTHGMELANDWQLTCETAAPVDCNDYTLTTECTTCGCGDPIGQVTLYNDGNLVDPATSSITWYVDGVVQPTNGNPLNHHYTDPVIVTANVVYNSPDGTINCDETLAAEVVCEGDCPTVQFATCDDPEIQENYSEECLTSGNICNGEESLVFVLDGAGNLIEDFMINWYDDGVFDTNPFGVQIGVEENCGPIPVRVSQVEGCNTLAYYEPDCCSQTAPQVNCGSPGGTGGNMIWWNAECGTDFYEVEVTCTNGFYYDLAIVSQLGLSGFYEFNLPSFGIACTSFNIHVRGFCTERQAYGPWSSCILYDQQTGCSVLTEGCVGGGFGPGGNNSSSLLSSDSQGNEMTLFPNPLGGDVVSIRLGEGLRKQSERLELRVMDVNGKMVSSEMVDASTGTHSIILSSQPDGIYLIGAYSENGGLLETSRLVKGKAGN